MDEFELSQYVFDFSDIESQNLIKGFETLVQDQKIISDKIDKNLPGVIGNSFKAFELIHSVR